MLEAKFLFALLFAVQIGGAAAFSIAYLVCKRLDSHSRSAAAFWAVALGLVAAGTLLLTYRGILPDLLTLVAANAMLLLGNGLRAVGIAAFFKRRKHLGLVLGATFLWVVLCLIPEFRHSLVFRSDYTQTVMAGFAFWAAWMAMRYNEDGLHSSGILGICLVVEGLAYVGLLVHYNSFHYSDFLLSLQSYILPFTLLTIFIVFSVSVAMMTSMLAGRFLKSRNDGVTLERPGRAL